MAIIAKMSNAKSAGAAINYAIGKNKGLGKNETDLFLAENNINPNQFNNRAVAMGATNGVDPENAVEDFKAWRQVNNQDKAGNQAHLIVQAFNFDELSASKQEDWQKANDLGVSLAEKLYPDYQSAVYTHIDGTNHQLHNHIVISKVSLETGKKLREARGEGLKRARELNDELAQGQGWHIVEKPLEAYNRAEEHFGKDSWRIKIKTAVDEVMQNGEATNFSEFAQRLSEAHIRVFERGKSLTYAMDVNGQERRVRGNKLGLDYNKEAIFNELERQATARQQQATGTDSEIEQREQSVNREIAPTGTHAQRIRKLKSVSERARNLSDNVREEKSRIEHLSDLSRRFADQVRATGARIRAFVKRRREQSLDKFGDFFSAFNQAAEQDREARRRYEQRQAEIARQEAIEQQNQNRGRGMSR